MIKKFLRFFYWNIIKRKNFSQENEEEILKTLFSNYKKGFYIDVGCYHPNRFSNTALLYKKGWNGINIDANPESLKLFNFFRKRDHNVRAVVSETESLLTYYHFNESALNGCLDENRVKILKEENFKVIKKEEILSKSLDQIIFELNLKKKKIELLDIDVEGYDFQVLRSINLNYYHIKVIIIETGKFEKEIIKYLSDYNYTLWKKNLRNSFFVKNDL